MAVAGGARTLPPWPCRPRCRRSLLGRRMRRTRSSSMYVRVPDARSTTCVRCCADTGPFSAKQLLNFDRDAVPLLIGDEAPFAGQVRVVVRPVPQPWHASSTYLHETALAVARLAPSERAALAHPTTNPFWVFSQALMRESERWYESPVRGKSGDQVRAELAALAVHVLSDEPRRAGTPPLVSLPDDTPLGQAVRAWTRVSDDGNTGAKIVPDLKYCVRHSTHTRSRSDARTACTSRRRRCGTASWSRPFRARSRRRSGPTFSGSACATPVYSAGGGRRACLPPWR